MSLRTKLIIILTGIVITAALASSTMVYLFAASELEQRAKWRLMNTAAIMAEFFQQRFDTELSKFEYWAAMPLVINTARDCKNPRLVSAFSDYFSTVVRRESYTSVNLILKNGECVASNDPLRMYMSHCREVVSIRPGAVAGFAGIPSIGRTLPGVADDRPLVPLTAPIRYQGKVIAILRSAVDMGRFG